MNIQTLIDNTALAISHLEKKAAQPLPRGVCSVLAVLVVNDGHLVRRLVDASAPSNGGLLYSLCHDAVDELDLLLFDGEDETHGLDPYCIKADDLEALLAYSLDERLSPGYVSIPPENCERNEVAFDALNRLSDTDTGRLLPDFEDGQPDALPDDVRKELQCFAERRRKVYRHCVKKLKQWESDLKQKLKEQADEEVA